jgi:hypothetical protein
MTAPSAKKTILKSVLDGLNDHLIAKFFEVERIQGSNGALKYQAKLDGVEVWAPLVDADLEMTLSWNSPFENIGSNTSFPTLQAMLQSGALMPLIEQAKNGSGGLLDKTLQKAADTAQKFEGRTGVTKLNSMQVFAGMPPVKIPVTALFSAWENPKTEVEDPVNCLFGWALPAELSADGSMVSRALAAARGNGSGADVAFPSVAPTLIGMAYKKSTYLPLVIESISKPISSPIDGEGNFVSLKVPMTLCSLTAIDRDDWGKWNPSANRMIGLGGLK